MLGLETCTLAGASPTAVSNAVAIQLRWQIRSVVVLHLGAATTTLVSLGIAV